MNRTGAASQRYKQGKRAIFLSMFLNLLLALFKGAVGYFSRSQAMIADAFNSAGDLMVNIVVLLGLRTAYKPADEDHPYGHGKAETLAQNIVGLLIIFTGAYLAFSSLFSLRTPITEPPASFALTAAVVSIAVKEGLFRYIFNLGKKVNSRALIANAWDYRGDVLSSLAAFLGIAGARLGSYLGYPFLYYMDPLAGVLVSALIVYMGMNIMRDAGNELMDGMCSSEILEEITSVALEVTSVKEVHNIRVRSSGPCLLVDLEIGVKGFLSVEEGHNVAHELEEKLCVRREEILSVHVHVGPCKEE
ncbi:MAG: cation diffusion facilitator family transporter [Bacillota bacterium]|nr:cation diffusion facilitator family transporter [Bacillota bacterium]